MKSLKQQLSKVTPLTMLIVLAFAGVMAFVIARPFAATGTATLYTDPSGTRGVTKGDTFNVKVRISTASNVPVTGASVYLSYPGSKVSVQNVSYSGSSYNLALLQTNSNGVLRIDRAALPAISGGNKLFATITFKANAAGSASLNFTNSSYVTSGDDDSSLPLQRNGVTYNISEPSSAGGSSGGSSSSSSTSTSTSTETSTGNTNSTSEASQDDSVSTTTTQQDEPSEGTKNKKKNRSAENEAQPIYEKEFAALQVIVIDQEKQPVTGAKITVGDKTVETNAEGKALFTNLSPGEHDLVVDYNGNKTFSSANIRPGSSATNPDSVSVTISKSKVNPLIWIVLPIIGGIIFLLVFFRKTLLSRLKGIIDRDNSVTSLPEDVELPKNPDAPKPGSIFTPKSE